MLSIATPTMWAVFIVFVIIALAVDLLVLKANGPHKVSTREALLWSLAWIALAAAFNAGLWWYLKESGNPDANRIGLEFLTGYLVEKALAVDNIFVFLMIFSYFAVPAPSQQRVLIYGVLGAIVLRAVMIFVGAALIQKFHWILYLFGLFLLVTGGKMLWAAGQEPDLEKNPVLRWITNHLPLTRQYAGEAFTLREDGIRKYTPLFVVMVMVAFTDVIFAVDSIPAIFAITTDPFIVLTSNVFAVLGLRALYFLLAGMAEKFHLLAYGLALVLMFIGVKMLIVDFYKIPVGVSLGVVAALIASAMAFSLVFKPKPRKAAVGEEYLLKD
ncbi:membrane protein [Arenimonas maotaiensis]|uniref:Membrane protein n=1 Tax=Arenimonas maotaiensis TaxID=1446479 RepID=A0A917CRC4_9GAMM|nr:TerC family protein [Arenimonas maotaiensis]GGF93911.1 membrane protein [Arenimonas maotaiensis]